MASVVSIFRRACKDFQSYYDKKCMFYTKGMESDEALKEKWVCWNEHDLSIQLSRFIYKNLKKNQITDIEVHTCHVLKPKNFEGYSFAEKIPKIKEKLKRYPEMDVILARENDLGPFQLCIELKLFHYSVEGISRGARTVFDDLKKAVETLETLKSEGICKRVALVVLDDYYWIESAEDSKKIQSYLAQCKKRVEVFYHTSQAKDHKTVHTTDR